MNKKILRTLTALCAALMLSGGFSVTAFAQTPEGEDDTNDSGVVYEEPQKEEPLTPDGNATLVDDFGGNKQLITVTTKNGNYFYILIDRDDEGENTVHFLNQVDEADLLALMEDGSTEAAPPAVCSCTEKCEAGKVNVSCPVCKDNMTACSGKEAEPEPEEVTEQPQEKSNTAAKIAMLEVVVIVLLVLEKKEKKKTAQKERNIQLQLEYPEIVSKMAVLMGSGMTVEQAWNRITARYLDERKNNDKNIMPAYEEMLVTEREISDGMTGRKAYAGFAERVKLPCYQKLVRIILQSIHKGSKGVCEMLEKESEDAFDERRLLALKLGEEAGTKMLMPMMIMMAIVIAIVIAPAIIDFKI